MESPSTVIHNVCAFDDPGTELGFSIAGGILDAWGDANSKDQSIVYNPKDETTKTKEMYESMKVVELQATSALLGVEYRHLKKRALIALLMEQCKTDGATEYLSGLTFFELQKECTSLGISASGSLADLVERIAVALKNTKWVDNKCKAGNNQ